MKGEAYLPRVSERAGAGTGLEVGVSAIDGRPCRLTVCRGCCCGTEKKVPGVDHDEQLARLAAVNDHAGRVVPVRTSTCLGICFQANVLVVQPSQQGRAAGGRPVWLGEITEDKLVEAIDDWVFEGGPGIAPLPAVLVDHVTSRDAEKPKKPKKPKKSKKAKYSEGAEKERGKADREYGDSKKSDKKNKKNKKDKKLKKYAESKKE